MRKFTDDRDPNDCLRELYVTHGAIWKPVKVPGFGTVYEVIGAGGRYVVRDRDVPKFCHRITRGMDVSDWRRS